MKANSTLLTYLIATSALVGCATNKTSSLDFPKKTDQASQVVATKASDLIKANSAEGYRQIANKYNENGNADMAIIAYQKSLILDQSYTKSLAGLAAIYANQGLYFLAIPLLEKAVLIEPNAVNYNNVGYVYYLVKQYQEAGRVLNQAILLDSNYAQARNNLALVNESLSGSKTLFLDTENSAAKKVWIASKQPIDKTPQTQTSSVEVNKDTSDSLSNQTQLTQTASNIYQLNSKNSPAVIVRNSISNLGQSSTADNAELPRNEKINTLQVVASGGVNFKHSVMISKLFDVADITLKEFKLSDSGKYLEVINGNGARGVAGAVASVLKGNGIENTKIADAKKFNYFRTRIEYRTGYRDDAVNLNHTLLNKPFLIRNDSLSTSTAIRLVLGRDLLANNI